MGVCGCQTDRHVLFEGFCLIGVSSVRRAETLIEIFGKPSALMGQDRNAGFAVVEKRPSRFVQPKHPLERRVGEPHVRHGVRAQLVNVFHFQFPIEGLEEPARHNGEWRAGGEGDQDD